MPCEPQAAPPQNGQIGAEARQATHVVAGAKVALDRLPDEARVLYGHWGRLALPVLLTWGRPAPRLPLCTLPLPLRTLPLPLTFPLQLPLPLLLLLLLFSLAWGSREGKGRGSGRGRAGEQWKCAGCMRASEGEWGQGGWEGAEPATKLPEASGHYGPGQGGGAFTRVYEKQRVGRGESRVQSTAHTFAALPP